MDVLNPPIEKVTSRDDDVGYSAILNACYHSNNPMLAMQETLAMLESVGFTQKQISGFITKAKANGVPYPLLLPTSEPERIYIDVDAKLKDLDATNVFQNVADNFLLYIYGKKFNGGVHGAFGKAQNIRKEAMEKLIIIKLPNSCSQFTNTKSYNERSSRFMSSVQHYKTAGKGSIRIEYY